MKKPEGSTQPTSGLSRKQLRTVEQDLGIFLDRPAKVLRTLYQQFGVYDEDEKHVGDICAKGEYFSDDELRKKIHKLFK